jgi:hypothetical protein
MSLQGQRTPKQALAMNLARRGELYEKSGQLVLRYQGQPDRPIKNFAKQTVTSCIAAGWLMRISQGSAEPGLERIITTVAGDAEMRRPYRGPHQYYRGRR